MNVIERTNLLLELLENKDFMMVDEISELMKVSKPTVRRDLQDLEAKGIIRRFRGGACLADKVLVEESVSISKMMGVNLDSKKKIAKEAARLIEDGDIIFMDSGSTTCAMVPFIEAKDIHVVTNNMQIAAALVERKICTYILGGEIQLESKSILEDDVISRLEILNLNKAFIGARGVEQMSGYSTTSQIDCNIKSMAMRRAEKSYVLADKSKLGKRKFFTYAQLEEAICITEDCDEAAFLDEDDILIK